MTSLIRSGSRILARFVKTIAFLLAATCAVSTVRGDTTLIPAGAAWKYLDNGSNQGTAWRGTGFSDAGWASGSAELGYGDGDEATVVSYGPNSSSKYITTYFRRSFDCPTPSAFATLKLRVVRDDGTAVYLNGQEIWRNNMPTGTIGVNVSGAGASAEITIQTTVPNPPSAPSNLTASATGISTIQLAWIDTAGNETGFVIERSTDGVAFVQVGTAGVDATGFGDANLAAGTAYFYRLSALNADGPSAYSNTASATTLTPQPPAAPSNMTATPISGTAITLAWTDNASNEDGFVLQRSLNGGAYITIATLAAGTTGYPDTGLQSGSNYTYRVQAFNSAGSSAYAQASATTLSAPVAPTILSATAISKSQINLAWSDVSGETSYVIERSINNDRNFAVIATRGANVTSFSNTGLAPAKVYFYRLRAVNGVGSSANSNTVSATTPKK